MTPKEKTLQLLRDGFCRKCKWSLSVCGLNNFDSMCSGLQLDGSDECKKCYYSDTPYEVVSCTIKNLKTKYGVDTTPNDGCRYFIKKKPYEVIDITYTHDMYLHKHWIDSDRSVDEITFKKKLLAKRIQQDKKKGKINLEYNPLYT